MSIQPWAKSRTTVQRRLGEILEKALSHIANLSYARTACANSELVIWLLDHGADPNWANSAGSLLDAAAVSCSIEAFDKLLAHGARLEDSVALNHAAGAWKNDGGRIEMMEHLISLGCGVNAPDDWMGGHSRGYPLNHAMGSDNIEHVRCLLAHGADMRLAMTDTRRHPQMQLTLRMLELVNSMLEDGQPQRAYPEMMDLD